MNSLPSPHPSWNAFAGRMGGYIDDALKRAGEVTPPPRAAFRYLTTDLGAARVVILGQDPYPQPGAATGRSFEVAGLRSWLEPFRQSSLRNIVRAIYSAHTGRELPWREVREEIAARRFKIAPPDRLWDELERQGVLFLNAYPTCRPGEPLSHRELWRAYAGELTGYLAQRRGAALSWFLWGRDAASFAPAGGRVYISRHPMMSTRAPDDFMKNPCFRETSGEIAWTGIV